jgi:hypothetical protein
MQNIVESVEVCANDAIPRFRRHSWEWKIFVDSCVAYGAIVRPVCRNIGLNDQPGVIAVSDIELHQAYLPAIATNLFSH